MKKSIIIALALVGFAFGANKYTGLVLEKVPDGTGKVVGLSYYKFRGTVDTIVTNDTLWVGAVGISATSKPGISASYLADQLGANCRDSIITYVGAVSKDADGQNVERYVERSGDGVNWNRRTLATGDSLTVGSTSGTTAIKRFADEYVPGYLYREFYIQKEATDNTYISSIRKFLKRACY